MDTQTVKNLPAMWRPRFSPWVGKIPWRREWLPTPVFLPGEFHGQRSPASYSPHGCKESDMRNSIWEENEFFPLTTASPPSRLALLSALLLWRPIRLPPGFFYQPFSSGGVWGNPTAQQNSLWRWKRTLSTAYLAQFLPSPIVSSPFHSQIQSCLLMWGIFKIKQKKEAHRYREETGGFWGQWGGNAGWGVREMDEGGIHA